MAELDKEDKGAYPAYGWKNAKRAHPAELWEQQARSERRQEDRALRFRMRVAPYQHQLRIHQGINGAHAIEALLQRLLYEEYAEGRRGQEFHELAVEHNEPWNADIVVGDRRMTLLEQFKHSVWKDVKALILRVRPEYTAGVFDDTIQWQNVDMNDFIDKMGRAVEFIDPTEDELNDMRQVRAKTARRHERQVDREYDFEDDDDLDNEGINNDRLDQQRIAQQQQMLMHVPNFNDGDFDHSDD